MGQTQSTNSSQSDEFNGNYDFFRALDLTAAQKVIQQWGEQGEQRLSWKSYFSVLLAAQEVLEADKEKFARKNWSPVCHEYAMIKSGSHATETFEKPTVENLKSSKSSKSSVSDDHTDDEASEAGEEKRSEVDVELPEVAVPSLPVPPITGGVHPVFMGYSTETSAHKDARLLADRNKTQEREERAMERAIGARESALNQMEEQFRVQRANREKKMEQITSSYNREETSRRLEYEKSIDGLDPQLVGSMKDHHQKQEQLHALAFKREIDELTDKNNLKSEQDVKLVKRKREELTALVDSKQFNSPIGTRLEEFSRSEILRCSDSLSTKMTSSQKLSSELMALKNELNKLLELDDPKVLKSKQFQELRSMVNVAETRLKESLKLLLTSKVDVEDAEALLLRASKLRKQEDDVLPLFQSISEHESKHGATTSGCRAMLLFVAIILLAQGTFEKKCNSLFFLINSSNGGLFDIQFVLNIGTWVFYALQALGYVKSSTQTKDVENSLIRGFLNFSVNFKSDYISEYEIKLLVANIVSKDVRLMKVFGYSCTSGSMATSKTGIGNYQLRHMTSIGLIGMEMVDKAVVINRIHYELQKHKPCLESIKRRTLHDQALSQGQIDNNRADYSKFFTKKEKTSSYYIKPLDTGIYTASSYSRNSLLLKATLKIQSYIRLLLDRKLAEKESKRIAYLEAKMAVIKQLKNRILKEFQQREATKGMAKMKWDTEVRMKQAKLRSQGQSVSRNEAVLIMIEEAMASAKVQIDERFKQFEPEQVASKVVRSSVTQNSLHKLFGVPSSFELNTEDVVVEEAEEDSKIVKDDDDDAAAYQPTTKTYSVESILSDFQSYYDKQPNSRFGELVHVGEDLLTRTFRLQMSSSEVRTLEHLFHRLRRSFDGFTEFKIHEILREFPSKRLFLRYISTLSDDELGQDLRVQFKFGNAEKISSCIKLLRKITRFDFESGILFQRGLFVESTLEKSLAKSSSEYFLHQLQNYPKQLSDKSSEDEVKEEEKRLLELIINAKKSHAEKLLIATKEKEKVDRAASAIKFVESQINIIHSHSMFPVKSFSPARRFEWNWRIVEARKALLIRVDQNAVDELKNIVDEFCYFSNAISRIIVEELYKPEYEKSIRIVARKTVNGRESVVGRGIVGHRYVYEACNIFFDVCLDYNGIYNGSDEFAAKIGGKERLGSQLLFDLEIPKFYPSLVATVDFFGFRVVASAKLPIVHLTFGDDGLVQSEQKELLHGMPDAGLNMVNKSRRAQELLKMVGEGLNLREHKCKGKLDPAPTSTYSARLKIYKGDDGSMYARQYSSLFVHELVDEQNMMPTVPREQSIFWRLLRPELLMSGNVQSQSVDVGTIITSNMDDELVQLASLEECTQVLQTKIRELAERLLERNYSLPFTINDRISLKDEFHRMGINMRYLGTLRALLWRKLPGRFSMFHHDTFLRTSLDMRQEVLFGETIVFNGSSFTIKKSPRNNLTFNRIPVDKNYGGDSIHKIDAVVGSTKNSDAVANNNLSVLILGEIVARCLKSLIRIQLRQYCARNHAISSMFFRDLICSYLNIISGSSLNSEEYFQEILFDSAIEHFGHFCIWPHERNILIHRIECARGYIIRRLMEMVGFKINFACLSQFERETSGFVFNRDDITDPYPVHRSSISDYPYLQGSSLFYAAENIRLKSYFNVVCDDSPLVMFTFAERRGSKLITNHGLLGSSWAAALSDGCLLELPGPVRGDVFIKAAGFRTGSLSTLDIKYDPRLVPADRSQQFSVEVFFRCTGGVGLQRTVVTCGRFSLQILRDNTLVASLFEEIFALSVKLDKITTNSWNHIVMTYDCLYLRIYQNGAISVEIEAPSIIDRKRLHFEDEHCESVKQLQEEESKEKQSLRDKVTREANVFFQSKEGVTTLKRMTQVILDLEEEDVGMVDDGLTGFEKVKQRKANAMKKAKEKYIEESFSSKIRDVGIRFKQLMQDLEDQKNNKIRDGKLKAYEPFRLGASLPDANNRGGSDYFEGDISCFSVFEHCLAPDRVRCHFLSSVRNVNQDAQRLYAKCVSTFNAVVMDVSITNEKHANYLDFYARSLCFLMGFEPKQRNPGEIATVIVQLLNLIQMFGKWKKLEPICQLLNHLPRDQEFAEIVVEAMLTIKAVDRNFLSKSLVLKRKTLINFPFEYALISAFRPPRFYDAAAYIFQEVVRDIELMFAYGDIDLRWIGEIRASKLVIALVRVAFEDKSLKVIKLSEFFDGLSSESLLFDEDVQVLSQYLPLSAGFDFSNCTSITNDSMQSLARLANIRILMLDNCSKINDEGLIAIKVIASGFESLSLENLGQVTDVGFTTVVNRCSKLIHLNVNRCHGISMESITKAVQRNLDLQTLCISAIRVNDENLVKLAAECSKVHLTKLDLSFCSDMTDLGLVAIADACGSLKSINLLQNSRLSTEGVRTLCSRCWNLENLLFEELFLISDDIFSYSPTIDGRAAANERMLANLRDVNVRGCDMLSDNALFFLSERCRRVASVTLSGCKRITDKGLGYFSDKLLCPSSSQPFCLTIKSIDLSFVVGITSAGLLDALTECKNLETFIGAGLVRVVDDAFLKRLGQVCPSIQTLNANLCVSITDIGLCSVAENLWVEHIELSGCYKISDVGIEVLAGCCSGLRFVNLSKSKRITKNAVKYLERNCPHLQHLSI